MSEHSIITVTFDDSAKAYQALSELKGAAFEGRVEVVAANVISRDEQGRIGVPESIDNQGGAATWGGGLIGLLIGVLGGPIGMLFGWTGGMLIGGAVDLRRDDRTWGALGEMSTAIPAGGTAVVADVWEVAYEVIDGEMAKLGGTVHRRDADVVLAEIEAAEEAYEQAEKDADRRAREIRRAERKEDFEQRKDRLKEKLGIS
jgi:uncharacterized membrane protein